MQSKPFSPEPAPANGWFEFELAVESAIRLIVATGGSVGTPIGKDSPYDGTQLFTLSLRAEGDSIAFVGKHEREATNISIGRMVASTAPFTLRIIWAATPDEITFNFQVDGNDYLDRKGNQLMLVTPNPNQSSGVEYFSITGGPVVIGKITASGED